MFKFVVGDQIKLTNGRYHTYQKVSGWVKNNHLTRWQSGSWPNTTDSYIVVAKANHRTHGCLYGIENPITQEQYVVNGYALMAWWPCVDELDEMYEPEEKKKKEKKEIDEKEFPDVCVKCGKPAWNTKFFGGKTIECSNPDCEHYKEK